jgi:hypothetical protein
VSTKAISGGMIKASGAGLVSEKGNLKLETGHSKIEIRNWKFENR